MIYNQYVKFILILFCFQGCTRFAIYTNISLTTDKQKIEMAEDDYKSVTEGKKPVHAISNGQCMLDGGTCFYIGDGYKLEVRHQISSENDENIIYGPIINFDSILENSKPKQMTNLKTYTRIELQALLNE